MRTARNVLLLAFSFHCALYAVDCSLQVYAPPMIRLNGRAEGIGDLSLVCTTPSTPTAVNISVSLPVPITSRGFAGTTPSSTEALLLVNEPGSGLPGASPQTPCVAADVLANTCSSSANVFPGFLGPARNVITFFNVPIPTSGISFGPPGELIILRMTNIRADLAGLSTPEGGSSPLIAFVQVTGSGSISVQSPTATVAYYLPGIGTPQVLLPDLSAPVPAGGLPLSQCVPVNKPLALDPASASAPDGVSFVVRIPEGFANNLKPLSWDSPAPADVNSRPPAATQNLPGVLYNDETMFYDPSFPGDLSTAGLATQATRILVRFTGPPSGVQVHAPVYELGKGLLDSRVRLVAGGPDGGWPTYEPLGPLSGLNTFYAGSQVYVYEVTAKAPPLPYTLDTIDLPFYLAHTGMPYVTPGTTSVNVTLAPTSNDATNPFATYIPRFADYSSALPVANLSACAGAPALRALISSRSGTPAARVWQIAINNYGTAAAANAKVTRVALTQTFGPACTPVVSTPLPVSFGTVAPSATVNQAVTINFSGCTSTSRFKVDIGFSADGSISGTSTFSNQFQ